MNVIKFFFFQGIWDVANSSHVSKPEECGGGRACLQFISGDRVASEELQRRMEIEALHSCFKFRIQQLHPLGP